MPTTSADAIRARPITLADNNANRTGNPRLVSVEFGLTVDKGHTVSDPNLDHLYELYSQSRRAYWVIELHGQLARGDGVATLGGANEEVCELQKMYFLPELRGRGVAWELSLHTLTFTSEQDFRQCYLKTAATLDRAIVLYEQLGFCHIAGPIGNTGHVDYMLKKL